MNYPAYKSVEHIWETTPKERGKILQIMLAIAFDRQRGGFEVRNKFSEGVDIDLIRNGEKYAVEVKCTKVTKVSIESKDIDGLRAKEADDNYVAAVAALRIDYPFGWVIGRASNLGIGWLDIQRLKNNSCLLELENIANREFERVVQQFKQRVFCPPPGQTPLMFLQGVLKEESSVSEVAL